MLNPDGRPSIGLLLCKSKKQLIVEYALRDLRKPIGVAGGETQLVTYLPEDLKGTLPIVEEIEAEFGGAAETEDTDLLRMTKCCRPWPCTRGGGRVFLHTNSSLT